MAKYIGNDKKEYVIDITKYQFTIFENVNNGYMCEIEIISNGLLMDGIMQKNFYICYEYNNDDVLHFYPIFKSLYYMDNFEEKKEFILSTKECEYFQNLLNSEIADTHTPEMQKVMLEYYHYQDKALEDFVKEVINGKKYGVFEIGEISEKMATEIKKLTNIETLGNKIVINADDIRHIIRRHGENGQADHSMKDITDISKIGYIIKNYDKITYDGKSSKHYLTKEGKPAPHIEIYKRINGEYFVIGIATDSKQKKSSIISAFKKS